MERKALEKQMREAGDDIQKADRELRKNARLEIPTSKDLDAARERRQLGWDHVLKAWRDGVAPTGVLESYARVPLADAYIEAVERADNLADRLRHDADRSAQLERFTDEKAQAEDRMNVAKTATDSLDARARQRAENWKRLWMSIGIEPGSPREMLAWRKRFEAQQEAIRRHEDALRIHSNLERLLEEQRRAIETALKSADLPAPSGESWKALCAQAQQTLTQAESEAAAIARLNQERETAGRDLERLESEQVADTERAAILDADWDDVVALLRLRPKATGREVSVILEKLSDLFATGEKRQPQDARRRAIYKQQANFEAEAVDLARRLAPDLLPPSDPMAQALMDWHAAGVPDAGKQRSEIEKDRIDALAQTLIERHAQAEKDAAAYARLTGDFENLAAELKPEEDRLKQVRRRIESLLRENGCDSEDELKLAEERSDKGREDRRRTQTTCGQDSSRR